jgi:hypothetical protein
MALTINGGTHSQVNYISGQKLNLAFKISINQHFQFEADTEFLLRLDKKADS